MSLSRAGANTLSQWERVAAEQPGEGFELSSPAQMSDDTNLRTYHARSKPLTRRLRRHPLPQGEGCRAHLRRRCGVRAPACSREVETPHPLLPASPSPMGGRFSRSLETGMRRSWRMRTCDIRHSKNFFDDPIEPFFHFVIGEAELDETMQFDQSPACVVLRNLFEMLLAIDLDHQPEVVTAKVCDEAGDRHLSAKFQPVEPAVAQLLPKNIFARRAPGAQTPCDRDRCFGHQVQFAHPRWRSQYLFRHLSEVTR
jgi:hypothetical protein